MKFTIGHLHVRIRFSLVFALCLLPMMGGKLVPLLILSIALHEAGHLLFLRLRGLPIESLDLSLNGVRLALCPQAALSSQETICLNAAGPGVNLFSTIFVLLLWHGMNGMRFAAVSLAVAAVSLLPLGDSDGAAILETALSDRLEPRKVSHWMKRIRFVVGILLMAALCFFLMRSGWHWYYLLGLCGFAAVLIEEII